MLEMFENFFRIYSLVFLKLRMKNKNVTGLLTGFEKLLTQLNKKFSSKKTICKNIRQFFLPLVNLNIIVYRRNIKK